MNLIPGSRIGVYEVLAPLGAGGMGEVYRARDTRLGRDVALKVLPQAVAADPDRRARLEREARVLASLNHPHIASIYGIEDSSAGCALVMELVDGDTLADRLALRASAGLPVGEALAIARQIADALESAHERGIIHRDLKPANVKVRADGMVKVLDFGLAKAFAPSCEDGVTVTEISSQAHNVVGTPAYMSPEQARGETADQQADIWSFGVVLYELLTGVSPFRRSTTAETLASVLGGHADYSLFPPETPDDVRRLIRRCVERDRKRRLQHIGDARIELEEALVVMRDGVAPEPTVAGIAAPHGRSGPAPRIRVWQATAIASMLVTVGLAAWTILELTGRADSLPAAQTTFTLLDADVDQEHLTRNGSASLPAISRDGQYVVYVQRDGDEESVWIRQTATASVPLRIAPPQPNLRIIGVTIKPDLQYVDFVTRNQTGLVEFALWRVPMLGGRPPRTVLDNVHSAIDWSPDGERLVFMRDRAERSELVIADAEGRNEQVLATSQDPRFYTVNGGGWPGGRPAWSRDGKVIAVPAATAKSGVLRGYVLFVTVSDGSVLTVEQTPPGNAGTWIDDVSLLWNRSRRPGSPWQLWRLSYPTGELSRLSNDLSDYSSVTLSAQGDSLAAARTETLATIWIGDKNGTNGGDKSWTAAPPGLAGSTLSWGSTDLFYVTLKGDARTIMAFSPAQNDVRDVVDEAAAPAASPGGGTIVYMSWGPLDKFATIWKADADGRHPTRFLSPDARWLAGITRDNQALVYENPAGGLWRAPLDGGVPSAIVKMRVRTPDLSPDGTSVAFVTVDQENRPTIVACRLPLCTDQTELRPDGLTVSDPEGGAVRWAPDGGIAYVKQTPQPNIWIQPLNGAPPRQLTRFSDGRAIPDFAWSRDGARLAILRLRQTTDIVLYKGLRPKS